jgi:hypothetical protein
VVEKKNTTGKRTALKKNPVVASGPVDLVIDSPYLHTLHLRAIVPAWKQIR